MVLTHPDDLKKLAEQIARAPWTALYVQGYGPDGMGQEDPRRGKLRLLALAVPGEEPVVVEVGRWKDFPPDLAEALSLTEWVTHDAHSTLAWMELHYRLRPPAVFCTLAASRLLTAGSEEANDLESLAERHEIAPPPPTDSDEWGGLFLSTEQLHHLSSRAATVARLRPHLENELQRAGLTDIYALECLLLPVVLALEAAGMPIDRSRLEELQQEFRLQLMEETTHLRRVFGVGDLNFSSSQQVRQALNERGLEVPDTREKTLLEFADDTLIPALLAFRSTEKQWQQVRSLLLATDGQNRIHSTFDPLGTDTGRFSSGAPNLQNVARGPVRSAFRAPDGSLLLFADYSQVELRAAAALAGDTTLLAAFARGDDPHRVTAAAILRKEESAITDRERQLAKSVNFGLLYGQGAEGLVAYARQKYGLRFSVDEAMVFRDRFFDRYRQLAAWHQQAWKMVQDGREEIRTPLGRRRLVSATANRWSRFTSFVNTPVQGGTADGLKWAMILAAGRLPAGARLLATIHDELIVEVPKEAAEEAAGILETAMVEGMARGFPGLPTVVSTHLAAAWG